MDNRWAPTPSATPAHRRMPWRNSPRSRRTPPAGLIQPCQPTLVAYPPAGPGWIHEVKHDGYRLIARKDAGRVRLWSRHGTDFTDKMPRIVEAVRNLPVNNALIDGEAVVLRLEDIAILSRCAPRPAASKPHSSPSTFSASNATISASKLSRTGERRSSNWSQELTASSSAKPNRPTARPCSPTPASWVSTGSCRSAS